MMKHIKKYTKKLSLLVGIILFISYFTGCATYSAYKIGATPEQWKEATCKDAGLAYALSSNQLIGANLSENAKVYWEVYKAGASTFMTLYCGK